MLTVNFLSILIKTRQHQWKLLDQIRRKMFIKLEIKRSLLLSMRKSRTLPLYQRQLAAYKQSTLPRSSSVTRVVNRCTVTGRKYSTLKYFQLSRFKFRFESYEGLLPGVRRDSW